MPLTEFDAGDGAQVAESGISPADGEFAILALDMITPGRYQPRHYFNLPRLTEMAESIKASGVHQPILVRPLPASRLQDTFEDRRKGQPLPSHELVAGERRYRASKLAGKTTIPVLIRDLTDDQVLEIQMIENLQRDDLHPMEEAEGYERMCAQLHISKEEVGAKVGKSRGYVYARLKLLDLTAKAREAFLEMKIDASRALVIARIPDTALQEKALTEATREDWQGAVPSFRAFVKWAQQNVMLRLDSARFDVKDATLLPDQGSCTDCNRRTGAAPDLFADVDSADICIDPKCFGEKKTAHDSRALAQAVRDGKKVIPIEKAEKIFEPYYAQRFKGYMELDRTPDSSLGVEGSNLRKALGKHCPSPVLVMDPKGGGLVEVVPTEQVKKAIKENGLSRTAKVEKKAAAKQVTLPIEERRAYAERWQRSALQKADAHFKGWTGEIPPSLLRAYLVHMFEVADEGSFGPALDLGTEFNTQDAINRLHSLPDSAMPEVFVRWMLHDTEGGYPDAWTPDQRKRTEPRHPTWEILKIAAVDVEAIEAEVRREMEGEDRVAAMEAEAKKGKRAIEPASLEAKGSKKIAPPTAQAKRGKKPSAEEVQGQIAEAFQALEEEANQAPDGAKLEEEGAAPAAPAVVFRTGQLVRVKPAAKDAGGKSRRDIGRVGRVVGAVPGRGQVSVVIGPRTRDLVQIPPADLEPYTADPTIGCQVRVLSAGLAMARNELMWQQGEVIACRDDGWRVKFAGMGDREDTFATEELEVLP